jgi:uncharacterized protein (DUF302 family)
MIKASDLIKEQKQRKKHLEKTYHKIYSYVEKKIIECNNINMSQCYYEIPTFMLNLPLYSFDECRDYIIKQLKNNGFNVVIYNPKVLLIKWG